MKIFIRDLQSHQGGFMVFESYPLIAYDSAYAFSNQCDETCFLNGADPISIRIEIINAILSIEKLILTLNEIENATEKQFQAKRVMDSNKIAIMAQQIPVHGMNWIPRDNPLVSEFYYTKKSRWGEKYNLLGYEYYGGGVYSIIGYIFVALAEFFNYKT